MSNKVRFGLSNVHYSKITYGENDAVTYATPVPWRGAVSLTIDVEANSSKFFADNGVWAAFDSVTGGTVTLEMADTPKTVFTDLLGFVETATGEIVENTTPITQEFCLLFEVSGNTDPIGYRLYRCILSRPGLDAETTNENTDPKTSSYEMTYMPIKNGDVQTIKGFMDLSTTAKRTAFYGSVALPTMPSA